MTLKEYLKLANPSDIALLTIDKNGEIESNEYSRKEYKNMDKELMNMEVRETREEYKKTEIWIK